jgi:hypothetical protein
LLKIYSEGERENEIVVKTLKLFQKVINNIFKKEEDWLEKEITRKLLNHDDFNVGRRSYHVV